MASTPELSGRTLLISGGTRGIGEAIARAALQAGAQVILCSRREGNVREARRRLSEPEHRGGRVHGYCCHVGRLDSIEALWEQLDAAGHQVDVLVNNAATNPHFGPLIEVSHAAWDKTFEVNLRGPFEMSRQLVRRCLAEDRSASIINISSIFGMTSAPLQGVYSMTKAALIALTRTLAAELGGAGVRVNAIAPGLVETRLSQVLLDNEQALEHYNRRAMLHRHAQPEEIAGAALYLASDASSYTTGQTLVVDGGYLLG